MATEGHLSEKEQNIRMFSELFLPLDWCYQLQPCYSVQFYGSLYHKSEDYGFAGVEKIMMNYT